MVINSLILQTALKNILQGYLQARLTEPNAKTSSMFPRFSELAKALEQTEVFSQDPKLQISWSTGKGAWAHIPWLAIFHNDETHSTQQGVYCIYLFKQDMSGLYLTLNQGVTDSLDHRVTGDKRFHKLHAKAFAIRKILPELAQAGFQLDNHIDLKSTSGLGQSYTHSTIAHKYYAADKLPNDSELLLDLDAVVKAYLRYVQQK